MNKFIVFGTWTGQRIRWESTAHLDVQQLRFFNRCSRQLQQSNITADKGDLAVVAYNSQEDFMAGVLGGTDATQARSEIEDMFNQSPADDGYPKVGDVFTLDELLARMPEGYYRDGMRVGLTSLQEEGTWPWPDARAVFQRQGDNYVVIEELV